MPLEPMFPKVNPLPGAKNQPAFLDGDAQIDCREGSANMRGHIVIALGGMLEQRITVRRQARKKPLQVAAHFGIGVLLNQQ